MALWERGALMYWTGLKRASTFCTWGLHFASAGSADDPLVAVLNLKGGKGLNGGHLLIISRPLASPPGECNCKELGLDAQESNGSKGSGLGSSEGEEGGGAGGKG